MHSSELPITEWWDPEWDVYDVPLTPNDGWWQDNPTPEQCDTWWAAYAHLWNIRWVMCGSAEYRPDFRGRELATGEPVAGWLGHRDLCPSQWGERCDCADPLPAVPCLCWYWTEAYGLRVSIRDPQQRHTYDDMPAECTGFQINPQCRHHGERARHVVATFKGVQVTREMLDAAPPSLYAQIIADQAPGYGFRYPEPRHDDVHNPYDLDNHERTD